MNVTRLGTNCVLHNGNVTWVTRDLFLCKLFKFTDYEVRLHGDSVNGRTHILQLL